MNAAATGRHEVLEGFDAVVFTRTFRSPITDVWAAVSTSDRMERWIGTWTGDPTSGAVQFRMNAEGDDVPESTWQIRACDSPRVLHVLSADDGGVWDLRLGLSELDGVTTLQFTQALHDVSVLESTGPGWDYYLDRLVAAQNGGDPSEIDFDRDYYPALSSYYRALVPAGD